MKPALWKGVTAGSSPAALTHAAVAQWYGTGRSVGHLDLRVLSVYEGGMRC